MHADGKPRHQLNLVIGVFFCTFVFLTFAVAVFSCVTLYDRPKSCGVFLCPFASLHCNINQYNIDMNITNKAQMMPIGDLKTNPNNPRLIKDEKFEQLVESLRTFPEMLQLRPIIVNEQLIILGGNMRHKAAMQLGIDKIPVIIAKGLTPEQEREFIVKDNVPFGEWDWEMLANEWDAGEIAKWGLDVPRFEPPGELEDLSDKLKTEFRIEVVCKDEQDQERTYNSLIEKGYECRLLTL